MQPIIFVIFDIFDNLHFFLLPPFQCLTNLNTSSGRSGIGSQLMPRAKETLPRVAASRTSSEKHSDFVNLVSDLSKENPRSCDICRRSETILNPILVCSNCKVL